MRILMLAQFYLPTVGGEERHVHDLSVALIARGHEVALATLWHEGSPVFEIAEGIRIYRIRGSMQRIALLFSEQGRQHSPPFPDPEVTEALRRIIEQERPDIVHAHNWMVHSFTPLKAWSKARLVVTLHDTSLVCPQKRYMYHDAVCSGPTLAKCLPCATQHYGVAKGVPTTLANWVAQRIERHTVDMFLPVSQAIADVAMLDTHPTPYRVVPNFVANNVEDVSEEPEILLPALPNGDYLLFVGDVRRDKGVDVLLQAYAGIQTAVPLVLIGRAVHDFTTPVPPNVQILPSRSHNAIMQAWRGCTIALAPSIWLEAFGIVAIEAMAMGRPLIASRIGGLADVVVDNETGILVPPGDEHALRDAMQKLLASPELRVRMGEAARQRSMLYQEKAVVPRIEQVYQEVVHR